MKTAKKPRRHQNLRPKHKQTKDYLKHYYPFLPLMVSIGLLLMVAIAPLRQNPENVLAYATNVSRSGLLHATNDQRFKEGVTTLTIDEQLNQAAQAKAEDMVTRNYWSHQTPEGSEPWTFILNTDYDYLKAGENLAFGFDSSTDTVKGWMTSETHRKNMLDENYQEVGFGLANSKNFNGSGPATVVVAMYATPAEQPAILSNSTSPAILGQNQSISNAGLAMRTSWATLSIGLLAVIIVGYLAATHTKNLKALVRRGEKLVIRHPLLDSAAICLLAISVVLLRTAGSIH